MPVINTPYANEMNILLACAGLNSENAQHIPALADQLTPNWPTVFQLAERHGILPLVWHNLKSLELPSIPETVKQSAKKIFLNNTQRALLQISELAKLTRLFQDDGIQLISLKGPALAMQAYGNLSLRHAGDIDIMLINPEDIWRAHALMQQAGYHYTGIDFDALTRLQKSTYFKLDQHLCYLNNSGSLTIELHYRWAKNPYYFQLKPEDAWLRSKEITLAGAAVKTLSCKDQLLYLCSHGAGHAWARLQWLCDIPILVNKAPGTDLIHFIELTGKLGEQRKVIQALSLSAQMLKMQMPGELATLVPDKTSKKLISIAKNEIIRELPYWQTHYALPKFILLRLRLLTYKPRLKKDIRYSLYSLYLATISSDDWRLVRLPDQLFFLYFILHPMLWLARRCKIIQ